MSEYKEKDWLKRFVLPLAASVCSAVLVGIGSVFWAISGATHDLTNRVVHLEKDVTQEKLLTRTVNLEVQIERHEKALERDFARHEQIVFELSHKTDDQEKRLTRLETLVNETQRLLSEISTDVKTLLRDSARH